jgi:predicted RNA binding protein with dsRBD fold (UPF0201 family)
MGIEILIEAEVYPTEDVNKIKEAILKIFPDAKFEIMGGEIRAKSQSIENFGKILKEERIRDAARAVLLGNLYGDEIIFGINKQVATMGKISFSVGKVPLGDIKITIKGENLREMIDRIAPDTRK